MQPWDRKGTNRSETGMGTRWPGRAAAPYRGHPGRRLPGWPRYTAAGRPDEGGSLGRHRLIFCLLQQPSPTKNPAPCSSSGRAFISN